MIGCTQRDCPCGKWINCDQYKDIYNRKWRRSHNDELLSKIHDWYDINFRAGYHYPDSFGNG